MKQKLFIAAIFLTISLMSFADDLKMNKLILKNHKFQPDILKVKAYEKFRLIVENQDSAFEEFESEKISICNSFKLCR